VSLPAPGSNPSPVIGTSRRHSHGTPGIFVSRAAPLGGVAPPQTKTPRDRRYLRELICPARAMSAAVSPPSEWVDRVSVTRFHWIVMSGWWFTVSAR